MKSYCIDANYYKGSSWKHYKNKGLRQMVRIGQLKDGRQWDRVYSTDGKSVSLSANGGGRGAKTGLYLVSALTETRTEEAKAIRREMQKQGKDFSPRRMKELKPREDGKANNITTGQTKESLILIENNYGKLDDRTLESQTRFRQEGGNLLNMQRGEDDGNTSQRRGLAQQPDSESYGGLSGLSHPDTPQEATMQNRGVQSDTSEERILRETQPKVQEVGESTNGETMQWDNAIIRKLTCIECERLQSLPDNYTEGVSNTQRYKALGNAFNVEVVKHILSFIK